MQETQQRYIVLAEAKFEHCSVTIVKDTEAHFSQAYAVEWADKEGGSGTGWNSLDATLYTFKEVVRDEELNANR